MRLAERKILYMANNSQQFKMWHAVAFAVILVFAIGNKLYSSIWSKTTIILAGKELRVLVADTPRHRFQGWSGKKDMGKYDGMIFTFQDASRHPMVMRDMYFPLDIIWLNGEKIVDIAPNLSPQAGVPEDRLLVYQARTTSTMVLEVPAGFMNETGVKIGDTVQIVDKN